MRDIDSITVQALQGLDANAANIAVLDLVQNSIDVAVKYDQAQAINNQLNLQKLDATRTSEVQNYQADQQFRRQLIERRNSLTVQLLDLQRKEGDLVAANTGDGSQSKADELKKTQALEGSLQTQIQGINQSLNNTPPSISDATLASTAATIANPGDVPKPTLAQIPDSFKNALNNALQQPTFPPAVRMDNVIDLLHQRMAREFSVMYDDLMRDSLYKVYLVEFDASIQPDRGTKDRSVRMAISLDNQGCAYPALAYELYPSAAAYNLMKGFNKTTHVGITGVAQTILGWGLSASFQHDHSSLRSGLSQSLYISGFGAGQSTFGWDFAPNPYESTLAPGVRTTYAILRVPAQCAGPLKAKVKITWAARDRRYPGWNPANWFRSDEFRETTEERPLFVGLPRNHSLQVSHISYAPSGSKGSADEQPSGAPSNPEGAKGSSLSNVPAAAGSATNNPAESSVATQKGNSEAPPVIQIRFRSPIDPNLIITANDRLLRRVRDVRGRALYTAEISKYNLAGNTNESTELSTSRFGLLESDKLDPDTWYVADSYTVLLNVSRATAGTDHFPTIRLLDPSAGGNELTELAQDADEVRIGEWSFTQTESLPPTAFQPLFTQDYDTGPFQVHVQSTSAPAGRLRIVDLRLVSHANAKTNMHKQIYLQDQAQVIVEADGDFPRYFRSSYHTNDSGATDQAIALRPNWALSCRQDRGAVVCSLPVDEMRQFCAASNDRQTAGPLKPLKEISASDSVECLSNYKVWLDQAPYYGRPGVWGDADPPFAKLTAAPEAVILYRGKYKVTEKELNPGSPAPEYAWRAELELVNSLPGQKYCISEFKGLKSVAKKRMETGFQTFAATLGPGYLNNVGKSEKDCDPDSIFTIETVENRIVIVVPYKFFALLPASLHLAPADHPEKLTELPNLRQQLIPRDVTILVFDNGVVHFQGDNLRAVDAVHLSSQEGLSNITALNRSFNALEFDISKTKPAVKPGKYFVKVALGDRNGPGDYFVDLLRTKSDGTEEADSVTIPPPPRRAAKMETRDTKKSSSGKSETDQKKGKGKGSG